MRLSDKFPLSDDTKNYAPPCSTLFNFFRVELIALEFQKYDIKISSNTVVLQKSVQANHTNTHTRIDH